MARHLAGKVGIVTGGGGGIGKAAALALADEGAHLVINDLGKDGDGAPLADKTVAQIVAEGGTAVSNYDSVAEMQTGRLLVDTALSHFGRVDILVNCAGNFIYRLLTDMTEADWDAQIDVHLKGHFSCVRAAVPEMIKAGGGRIITISSRAAFGNRSGGLAYAAAKAGIMGASAQMAKELQQHHITVNCLLPSADTALFPKAQQRAGSEIPQTVSLDPAYVAPLIAYLCTDLANDITGQFFYAAGGDVLVYHHPLTIHTFARKDEMWTIDDLVESIPPLLGLGD
jgi:3-oxoacyl-[acyl-carrier protein] reductase